MGKTSIEWVVNPDGSQGETLNPFRGITGKWHCTKVAESCRNCYAERINMRFGGPPYQPMADNFQLRVDILNDLLHWRKPRSVFICDMTDFFHHGIMNDWRALMWAVMAATPQHRYYVLTKRPDYAMTWFQWLEDAGKTSTFSDILRWLRWYYHWRFGRLLPPQQHGHWPLPNVWLGASAGTQAELDIMLPLLLSCPAAHHFLSLEPLLEEIDLPAMQAPFYERVKWVITGCESGPKRRPCSLDWIEWLLHSCHIAGVPAFVKQIPEDGKVSRDPDQWPKPLQVRQFPHE